VAGKSPRDTKLSSLIARARFASESGLPPDPPDRLDQSDRGQVDQVFSEIADAIERGLTILDPLSRDAALLKRLRRELKLR